MSLQRPISTATARPTFFGSTTAACRRSGPWTAPRSLAAAYLPNPGPTWHVAEAADFNGDGKSDITATTRFTIEVDNDPLSPTFGQVTFAQTQNIWHDDTSDSDDPEALTTDLAGDLKLTQTVTDADGDTASASINLGAGVFVIQDDGPNAVVANATADTLVLDETRPVGSEEDGDSAPAALRR